MIAVGTITQPTPSSNTENVTNPGIDGLGYWVKRHTDSCENEQENETTQAEDLL
jgi:hypothetical protein